ncbi:hypothetical protein OBBRIDRAFT_410061 [Obba rivulosa]|uniref:Uncharacterized protein n=1 Tax=Obba rivulosa TaxID=1052685 RepID=A0A8E2B537_9APHY|nr:hypothetical protein OBBRIDRAFT_410061 [Obba rivulosa]
MLRSVISLSSGRSGRSCIGLWVAGMSGMDAVCRRADCYNSHSSAAECAAEAVCSHGHWRVSEGKRRSRHYGVCAMLIAEYQMA